MADGTIVDDVNADPEDDGINPQKPAPKPAGKPQFTDEQQTHINNIIARETSKAVTKALEEANAEAEATKKKEMKAALKAQEKFEELAGTLQAEVQSLQAHIENLQAENDVLRLHANKYAETIEQDYTDFVEKMPAAFRVFDPGPDSTLDDKRRFIENARTAQSDLGEPFRPGASPTPPPARPATDTSVYERELETKMRAPMYTRISG